MNIPKNLTLKLLTSNPRDRSQTAALSARSGLPVSSDPPAEAETYLSFIDKVLTLVKHGTKQSSLTKISVDFLAGHSGYRLHNDLRIGTPFAKAMGIKSGIRPTVCDATAGFGQDAFHLASLGCCVTMIERSPIILLLLEDALERGSTHPKFGSIFRKRISLMGGNAITLLPQLPPFQTIYLDPMYPARAGAARSKKAMYLLREVVGDDPDADELFNTAQNVEPDRIVVKRPGRTRRIASAKPAFEVAGKHIRYDVYLPPYL